jgi:hypothetical protein
MREKNRGKNAEKTAVFTAKKIDNRTKTVHFLTVRYVGVIWNGSMPKYSLAFSQCLCSIIWYKR